ncbi:alpha/beta hydrolase domain-containing protein 13-like protein [Dinothrombium tinctorium]|uniref:Protein ABHD13 n=1 Tax=Dinothrombium tinctorium TaxID=1965070 RepID=A0A3S4QPM2_9ACAR|nr:alpha/beta hydrolase domain-containing protein 13-like protein [Dinothrombium tinctorium]RWS10746.1 alpha/beta hydrolase domain-containing protein 13-like protein [Dinothrombium tinctorium]RWS10748.1 alpha/beta hydrolase domain-containing protein 13-like protein [Dinothrombium tinctorium]
MRFIRLRKCHFEAVKVITRVLLFLLKKCWLQFAALIVCIVLLYGFYGGLIALSSGFFGACLVLYKLIDWFLYHPEDPPDSRTNVCSPAVLKLPFHSTHVRTVDGVDINLVFIAQPNERLSEAVTLIYFHGNAGNIGHRLLNVSELYHNCKCNILLVEYRGYGQSKGSPSESGLYLDGEAALNYALNHPDINKSKIVLFGRSLGGAVALEMASSPKLNAHISAVIIENTFTSIPDVAKTLFDCQLLRMIPRCFYKSKFDSLSKISRVSVPTLFLSGMADELIPPSMMQTLYQSSRSIMKQFSSFDNGTHNFTWRCKDYYTVINSFLAKIFNADKCVVENEMRKVVLSPYSSTFSIASDQLKIPSVLNSSATNFQLRSENFETATNLNSIEVV